MFNEVNAKRLHRGILFPAVAARHDDRCPDAVYARRKSDRLSVVAARCADYAGGFCAARNKLVEVDETTAYLEGAGRRVILVLDPQIGAQFLAQQRPRKLRCGT